MYSSRSSDQSISRIHRWVTVSLIVLLLTSCTSAPLATPEAGAEAPTATRAPTASPIASTAPTATATVQKPTPSATPRRATPSPEVPTDTPAPPTVTPTNTPRPRPPRMASPEYGMHLFMWWRPEVATRDLGLIEDAGFGWAKQDFAWKDIEGTGKGQLDWSRTDWIVQYTEDAGLDLLVRIFRAPAWTGAQADGPPSDLSDLADFAYALASRYRGRIRAYQVWNEPNLAREWGGPPNPEAYVALLKVAYEAIKEADPGAIVISAGLSPTGSQPPEAIPDDVYLRRMYQAGAAPYFDVLGLHAPGFKAPPEMSPDEVMMQQEVYGHGRWFCFRHVEDMRQIMVESGDGDKQVAVLEFGWTTDPRPESPYNWHAVDEATQAAYLVRAYQYAKANWSPWIGLMCLIYISDPDWTPQHEQYWWSITWPGYPEPVLRPAYEALIAMPK